jgi:hypothetical protein
MSTDLTHANMHALLAICAGREFISAEGDGRMAVILPNGKGHEITTDDLAALSERALIAITDDPATGEPARIDPTEWGKTFLQRWCVANRVAIVQSPVPQGPILTNARNPQYPGRRVLRVNRAGSTDSPRSGG